MSRETDSDTGTGDDRETRSADRRPKSRRSARTETDPALASRSRQWRVPPAIHRDPTETFEGIHVLTEFETEDSVLLWSALRDVTLWSTEERGRRGNLFHTRTAERRLRLISEAQTEPGVEVLLVTLAAVPADPDGVDEAVVSMACLRLSHWAEQRGALGTALSYAQAAALALPERAGPAYSAGRLAGRWGRAPRAEVWYRRALALARRSGEWDAYARSYAGLARILVGRGAYPSARKHFIKAVRAARRHGIPEVRARALHGLFLLALRREDHPEADRLARALLRTIKADLPEYADVVSDVARYWMASGRRDRAVGALRRVLESIEAPDDKVAPLALLARAAAEADDRNTYEDAWNTAWMLASERAPSAFVAPILDLARASALQADWLRVRQALQRIRDDTNVPEHRELIVELEAAADQARADRRGSRSPAD